MFFPLEHQPFVHLITDIEGVVLLTQVCDECDLFQRENLKGNYGEENNKYEANHFIHILDS